MKEEDKNFGKQTQNRQQIAQFSEMIEQRSNNAVGEINTLGTQTKFFEHIPIFSNLPLSKNAQNRFFFQNVRTIKARQSLHRESSLSSFR